MFSQVSVFLSVQSGGSLWSQVFFGGVPPSPVTGPVHQSPVPGPAREDRGYPPDRTGSTSLGKNRGYTQDWTGCPLPSPDRRASDAMP